MFVTQGPNDLYLKWMRTWPNEPFIRHLSFGNSEVLLVNSLKAHKEVMQTKAYSFVKPAFFEKLMGEFLGRGVLFSVGDEHRLQRRFLAGESHDICALRRDQIGHKERNLYAHMTRHRAILITKYS
jgi:hypothetical protein